MLVTTEYQACEIKKLTRRSGFCNESKPLVSERSLLYCKESLAIYERVTHNRGSDLKRFPSIIYVSLGGIEMRLWNVNQCLVGLHHIQGIGWHTIQLCSTLIGLSNIHEWLNRSAADWQSAGFKPSVAERLAGGFTDERLNIFLEKTYNSGVDWITLMDEAYPEYLKESPEPPWVLYGMGAWEALHLPCIAIVGTRHCTGYGRKVAYQLGRDLALEGVGVVSGLARGIDAAAHEGALTSGSTIAVLGSSCQNIYPQEHHQLAQRIAQSGLVLSESPIGTASHPGLFPRRNRIIAGLSLGTVVVESQARGGAMITASLALEMSREVFAVPGPVTSPKSEGTLQLIREGAAAVGTSAHIMKEIRGQLTTAPHRDNNETVMDHDEHVELNDQEQMILDVIEAQESTFDELLMKSGLTFAQLHHILLSLQLHNRIQERPGGVYGSIWT